ncbi:MAG TPA: aminomethyl-transferring glycine dehydrogenase subunit GcvPB, partial [Dehalococcoidia bacterium]|nr:aminomethyl-transferring glycine dehydrogenase subunit GcvPB [Dehalococcoidia bacterium]
MTTPHDTRRTPHDRLEPALDALSRPGRIAMTLPPSDVPAPREAAPQELLREDLRLPELSQLDVVRHFTRLSQMNWSIDTHMYPLG